jgi:hypothetical protein
MHRAIFPNCAFFFIPAGRQAGQPRIGVFLLIINEYVGSFASSRMLSGQAELPKTAQKLRTTSQKLRTLFQGEKCNKINISCLLASFSATSLQVTTGMATGQKENLW